MKAMTIERLMSDIESFVALPSMKVVEALTADSRFREHFYLTGYEGICLDLGHESLTRAIISSAVPMEGELLVIGSDSACNLWHKVCAELRIRVSFVDAAEEDLLEAVEAILTANKRIGHVLCTSHCSGCTIKAISALAHKSRAALIVDTDSTQMEMSEIEANGIDFCISTPAEESEAALSIVIARRSRLVMTEGNARNAEHDIYSAWQDCLSARKPSWAPMS